MLPWQDALRVRLMLQQQCLLVVEIVGQCCTGNRGADACLWYGGLWQQWGGSRQGFRPMDEVGVGVRSRSYHKTHPPPGIQVYRSVPHSLLRGLRLELSRLITRLWTMPKSRDVASRCSATRRRKPAKSTAISFSCLLSSSSLQVWLISYTDIPHHS